MNANDVVDFAQHVIDTVVETFGEAEVALPALQIMTMGGQGTVVHLCEQLTVSVEEMYSGTPVNQGMIPVKCNAPRTLNIAVELVRKSPTGTVQGRSTPLPVTQDADQQTTVAKTRMIDMDLLMTSGLYACETQWYGEGIVHVSAAPPDGGYQALVLSITTAIGGM